MQRHLKGLLILLSSLAAPVSHASETLSPSCGGTFMLCGYVTEDHSTVIPFTFEKAHPFQFGLAAVRVDGLWGYIDMTGELVISPAYLSAGDFHDTRAEVVTADGAGVIDRTGTFIIPAQFDRAIPINAEAALVKVRSTKPAHDIKLENHSASLSGTFRLYNNSDGWLTEDDANFKWFTHPKDGSSPLIWATDGASRDPFGLMDMSGNWVVRPIYRQVQWLSEGLAVVRKGKWGAVDETGKLVIPLEHVGLSYFENEHAQLGSASKRDTRSRGLLRSDGVVVAAPIYDRAERPSQPGGLPRVKQDGRWFTVTADGLTPENSPRGAPDGSVIASCPQGLQVVRQGKQYLLTQADGTPSFTDFVDRVGFGIANADGGISGRALNSFDLDCSAPIVVVISDKTEGTLRYTYVTPDGRSLFSLQQNFQTLSRFHFGYAVVGTRADGEPELWGIIDQSGAFSHPLGPKRIQANTRVSHAVGRPVFFVQEAEGQRMIGPHGEDLPEVEAVLNQKSRRDALTCDGGAKVIGDGTKFGLARENGEILIPMIHRAISCYRNGVAWAPKEDTRKWCPIGPDGVFRTRPACREAYYPMRISHHYPEKFSPDPFESSVLWVRAALRYGFGLRNELPGWVGDGVRGGSSRSIRPFTP